jgi:uracil-DNA glycosylase family 4
VTDLERRQALDAIAAEVRVCTKCRLHETRTLAVPGEGDPETEVVFVGEGPGRDEDAQGRPFVGESGRLLTRLIGSLGWGRDEVYITNVVKCRPPGNRDPQPDEIAACAGYLQRQLDVLDPALIVTLGRFSLGSFRPGDRIGAVHGTTRPAASREDALAFAMYHPAYAVRDKNNEPTLFADMTGVPGALIEARRRRSDRAASAASAGRSEVSTVAVPPGAVASSPAESHGTADSEAPAVSQPAATRPATGAQPAAATPTADEPTPQLTLF